MHTPDPARNSSYNGNFSTLTFYGSILGIGFTLGFALFYGLSGYPPVVVNIILFASLIGFVSLVMVRFLKRPLAAAHLATLCLFTALFGPALFTGGIFSSSLVWLVLVPVVASLMAGKRASLFWGLITIFSLSFILILNRVLLIDLTLRASDSVDNFTDLVLVMVVTMAVTWLNETTKQRTMDKLEKTQTDLEATNQELEAFVYSVSHDLRAPLRSIDGYSKLLQDENKDLLRETGKGYLGRIRYSTYHMTQLIDDLLKLSRVANAEMWIINVDLCALAREAVIDLQTTQPDRKVKVILPDELLAKGDPNLMRIALKNLISNSWKYTGKRPDAQIELGSLLQDGKRVFFIKDNGAGFDMAYVGKLFKPFQRLHAISEYEGTGIGLTIVQRIIQRHSGRIWAKGTVNQGATFYFTLE